MADKGIGGGKKEFVSAGFKGENFWLTQKTMAEDEHSMSTADISEFDPETAKYLKGGDTR